MTNIFSKKINKIDIEAMLASMKQQGGPEAAEGDDDADSDDDGPPPLEDA